MSRLKVSSEQPQWCLYFYDNVDLAQAGGNQRGVKSPEGTALNDIREINNFTR